MNNKSYHVTIHTADQFRAGTDSNIFLVLQGNMGKSDEVRLNGHLHGNAFERDDTDKLCMDAGQDCGDIYRLYIRSDCKYSGSGWRLAWIEVQQDKTGAPVSRFDVNEWIEDTNTRTLDVSRGLTIEDTVTQVCETRHSGEIVTVPANSSTKWDFSYTTTIGVLLSETTIDELDTSTSVSTEAEYKKADSLTAKAAISFGLTTKHSETKQEELKYDHIEKKDISITLEPADHERKFWVNCTYKKHNHVLTIGSLTYHVPIVDTAEFSGFEDTVGMEVS